MPLPYGAAVFLGRAPSGRVLLQHRTDAVLPTPTLTNDTRRDLLLPAGRLKPTAP